MSMARGLLILLATLVVDGQVQVWNALHDSRGALGDAVPCCEICDRSLLGGACPASMPKPPARILRWSEFVRNETVVEIPCGFRVDLDVDADVAGLYVRGHLHVTESVKLRTGFIYVCGVFSAGTFEAAYEKSLEITLTKHESLRMDGIDYGTRAFATFGGLVYLRGAACPQIRRRRRLCTVHDLETDFGTWTYLAESVYPGNRSITLRSVARGPHWQVGAKLVIASTDWDDAQNEEVTIARLRRRGILELEEPLRFAHSGEGDTAAEVATLTRNIKITSDDACLEGDARQSVRRPACGHFIISHTPHGMVCGVEFVQMGAHTTLGKYPLHIHMGGPASKIVLRGNSIHNNYNRAVVIHSTSETTIAHNVAYMTQGHVYVFENGLEVRNRVYENFGAGALAPSPKWTCPENLVCAGADGCGFGSNPNVDLEFCGSRDDGHAEIFWIANPQNDFIRNVAVGGQRSAFSFYPVISGPLVSNPEQQRSAGLPDFVIEYLNRDPVGKYNANFRRDEKRPIDHALFYQRTLARHLSFSPGGCFDGNVAHSSRIGFHIYPQWTPRTGHSRSGKTPYLRAEQRLVWSNLTAFKISGAALRVKTRCASWSCLTIKFMTVISANMIARSRDVFSRLAFATPRRIATSTDDVAFSAGACLSVDIVPAGGDLPCSSRKNKRYTYTANLRRGFVHCATTTSCNMTMSWPPREAGASQLVQSSDGRYYPRDDHVENRGTYLQRPCELPLFAFNYDADTVASNLAVKCALTAKAKRAGDLHSCYTPQTNATLATAIRVDDATLAMVQNAGYDEGESYDGMRSPSIVERKGRGCHPRGIFGSFHVADPTLDDAPLF